MTITETIEKAAVCLIVKDEDDYILEWLIHYENIGFDAAIVYDNGSQDRTAEVVQSYSAEFDVRYIHWVPGTHDPQIDAYNDCIDRYGKEFDWIGFFDIDEMLIPVGDETCIKMLLRRLSHASAIGLHWLMFGSNGLEDKGPMLMMEAFTKRADLGFSANRNTKAIVRPACISAPCNNPHWFPVTGKRLNLENQPLEWCSSQEGVTEPDAVVHGEWRLHHYYTRGKTKWRARLARGQFGGLVVLDEHFTPLDRNDHEDRSALPSARKVREVLDAYERRSDASENRYTLLSREDEMTATMENLHPLVKPHEGLVYTTFMSTLISRREARTYLEIGVENGHCLSQIEVDRAIAIDPAFKLTTDPTKGKRKLELNRTTSDSFFRSQVEKLNVDFAFLDGLHLFEFLLRDIYNVESHCTEGGVIAIHDALPLDQHMISREDTGGAWTGDIWKVIPIIEKYRPDIGILLVDCAPTGLVLLTNLDPSSAVLRQNYIRIVKEFRDLPNNYDSIRDFYKDRKIMSAESILKNFDHTLYLSL